jgi:hypothetical protein
MRVRKLNGCVHEAYTMLFNIPPDEGEDGDVPRCLLLPETVVNDVV